MATVIQTQNPRQPFLDALSATGQNFVQARQQAGLQRQAQQQQQAQRQDLVGLSQAIQQGQQGGNLAQLLGNFQPQSNQGAQALFNLTSQLTGSQGDPFTLSQGQTRFGAGGQEIASVAPEPEPIKPRAGALQVARTGDESGLDAGTVFQADPQGNVKIISEPGGEALSKADRSKIAITQAKEFRTDERIKNLQIVERSERGMAAALKQSTSPNVKSRIASDQVLGVLFQKMLDPTSVVRESEFARTPEGAALVNRLLGGAEQIVKGGLKLTNEDRTALVAMAQKLLDEAKITANTAFSEFEVRADELNLNKKIVFGGSKPFDIQAHTTQPTDIVDTVRQNIQQGVAVDGQVRTPQQEARMQELLNKRGQ